jgi:hypothetical protein
VWCDFGAPLHAAHGDAWAWLHLVLSMENLIGPDHLCSGAITATMAAAGVR